MANHGNRANTKKTPKTPQDSSTRTSQTFRRSKSPLCLRRLLTRLRPGNRDLKAALLFLAAGLLMLSLVLGILIQLPQAPYNVQELFDGRSLYLSLPLFAAFLIWINALPNLLARVTIICPMLHLMQALGFFLIAAPAWLLLRLSVSSESLHDILGVPVLGGPGDWELFVRYLAIVAPFVLSLFYWNLLMEGSALLNRRFGVAQLLGALILGLPLLWLSKYIVIDLSATDNIIQLSAFGPRWQVGGALIGVVALITLNGVLLAWAWLGTWLYKVLLALLTPLFFGICSWLALQAFSNKAMLLLLGVEHGQAGAGEALLLRWGLLYLAIIALTSFAHLIPFRLRGAGHTQRQALKAGSYPYVRRVAISAALNTSGN